MPPPSNPLTPGQTQALLDELKHQNERFDAFFLEGNKQIYEGGIETLKQSVIVNGGAVFSIFTFLGAALSQAKVEQQLFAGSLKSLVLFGSGAGCAVVAMGIAYLSNYLRVAHSEAMRAEYVGKVTAILKNETPKSSKRPAWMHRIKRLVHLIGLVVSLGSLFCFGAGMYVMIGAARTFSLAN